MRQIIAMEVASDHNTYNEGVLGRPNAEYCAWIQQPSSWGGAIEVYLYLSYLIKTEIFFRYLIVTFNLYAFFSPL